MIMKWLRLTTKECDMLDFFINDWKVNNLITTEDDHFSTGRNMFTPAEAKALQKKVQTAYWDKENTD